MGTWLAKDMDCRPRFCLIVTTEPYHDDKRILFSIILSASRVISINFLIKYTIKTR